MRRVQIGRGVQWCRECNRHAGNHGANEMSAGVEDVHGDGGEQHKAGGDCDVTQCLGDVNASYEHSANGGAQQEDDEHGQANGELSQP